MMEMGAVDLEISDELYRRLDSTDDPERVLDLLINTALDDAGAPSSQPEDQAAILFCNGPCRNFQQHVFVHTLWVPNGQSQIFACSGCGTERRYGLLGRQLDD